MTGYERLKNFAVADGLIDPAQCDVLHEFYGDKSNRYEDCMDRGCESCFSRFIEGCINQIVVNGEMDFGVPKAECDDKLKVSSLYGKMGSA